MAVSPPDLVSEPFDSVQIILQRFCELGFTTEKTVAVVGGSHSIAGADGVGQAEFLLYSGLSTHPPSVFPAIRHLIRLTETTIVITHLYKAQIFVDVQLRGTLFPGHVPQFSLMISLLNKLPLIQENIQGAVETSVPGTVRLQSDHFVDHTTIVSRSQTVFHHHLDFHRQSVKDGASLRPSCSLAFHLGSESKQD
ncbi:LOW QUALITY PROTEIN: hypothetical protein CVT25_007871 [Psilocybe cyanescens]|uniref:Peroxidase n=1 Tax=Psilocybe cyanescens TaxID=93625 RepID=A0A409XJH7_PSICY|nr:LOW QUALITY PROTEIN: hypothetical protein CVT25_007871 [Psilocybe cyanescens]